ncbi:MAG TPA: hypothetical protein VGD99_13530 [Anaerolineae bacterium]
MNISKHVIEQLATMASKGPQELDAAILDSAKQRGYIVGLQVEEHGLGVSVNMEDYDRYSATLRNLSVRFEGTPATEREAYLRRCAEQLSERLTYLEGPLVLLELDVELGLAQLRTEQPQQDDSVVTYWEVLVNIDPKPAASLARYHWSPGDRDRQAAIYPATFTTLGRLTEDLAESLAWLEA